MRTLRCIALMGIALCIAQEANARIEDLRSTADGATAESAVSAAKVKLIKACKKRSGISDSESFRLVSEDKIAHPEIRKPYQVEASMKCDIQGDGASRDQVTNNR